MLRQRSQAAEARECQTPLVPCLPLTIPKHNLGRFLSENPMLKLQRNSRNGGFHMLQSSTEAIGNLQKKVALVIEGNVPRTRSFVCRQIDGCRCFESECQIDGDRRYAMCPGR